MFSLEHLIKICLSSVRFYLLKINFKIKETGVSFVPVRSGLTYSCSTQFVNGLVGQGHLLVVVVDDVSGCLKFIKV